MFGTIEIFIIVLLVILIFLIIKKKIRNTYYPHDDNSCNSRWKPGDEGEYYVTEQLLRLDTKQYLIINDLLFRKTNGTTIQIDHIVVSPYGVFVIETKNISGYIYGTEKANQWLRRWKGYAPGGYFKENELSFDNPIRQNDIHIDALSNRMGKGMQIPYYSIIAFSPEATLQIKTDKQNVIYWSEIRDYIRQYDQAIMSAEEANNIFENIIALNIEDPAVRSQHAESANARKEYHKVQAKNAINNGKCPKCDGKLVKRTGEYGDFYGCSNYPNCKYTHPAC